MIRTSFTLVLVVLFLAGCAEIQHKPTPPSPLVSGLTGDRSQKSDEFDKRIKTKFPIGTDVSALKVELARNEFSIVPPSARAGELHFNNIAFRNGNNINESCSEAWTISWNEKLGKITDIDGTFGLMCVC